MRLFSPRYHLLSHKFTEHLNGRRTESGVMVVRVHVDWDFYLPQDVRPLFQFGTPIYDHLVPNLRLFLNSFSVSQQSDVSEVSGDRIKLFKPLRWPWHPRLVNQCKSDAVFSQGLNELRHQPIFVSDLDGEFVVLGQLVQEWSGGQESHSHRQMLSC